MQSHILQQHIWVILFMVCCSTSIYSQSYILPRFIGEPTNTCDNTVIIERYNFDSPSGVFLTEGQFSSETPVHHLDTIENYCFSHNWFPAINSFQVYLSNGFRKEGIGDFQAIKPNGVFQVIDYQEPSSNFINDGWITLQFDSIISNEIFNYYNLLRFTNQSSGDIDTTYIDNKTIRFINIGIGILNFGFESFAELDYHPYYRFYIGNTSEAFVETGLIGTINYQNADGNCAGWLDIDVEPNDPTSFLSIHWEDDILAQYYLNDVCPGIYRFYVSEFSNVGAPVAGWLDSVIITNDNGGYIDSSYFQNNPEDTIYHYITECDFDYFTLIDSTNFYLDTLHYDNDSLVAIFNLTVYQTGNEYLISDTIYTLLDSLTLFNLVIYCEDTVTKSIFKSQRFLIMNSANGFISVATGTLNQEEISAAISKTSIYPNPSNGLISIKNNNLIFNTELNVFDFSGKLVYTHRMNSHSNIIEVDLRHLQSGIYSLQIDQEMQKIVIMK